MDQTDSALVRAIRADPVYALDRLMSILVDAVHGQADRAGAPAGKPSERVAWMADRLAEMQEAARWRVTETETPPTWDLIEVRWWRTERYAEFARYCPDMERPWRKAGLEEMQPPTHWRPLGPGPNR